MRSSAFATTNTLILFLTLFTTSTLQDEILSASTVDTSISGVYYHCAITPYPIYPSLANDDTMSYTIQTPSCTPIQDSFQSTTESDSESSNDDTASSAPTDETESPQQYSPISAIVIGSIIGAVVYVVIVLLFTWCIVSFSRRRLRQRNTNQVQNPTTGFGVEAQAGDTHFNGDRNAPESRSGNVFPHGHAEDKSGSISRVEANVYSRTELAG